MLNYRIKSLKRLLLLVLLAGLQFTATARVQDVPLNVTVNNAKLETVLKIIRQQSDYLFIFRDENMARVKSNITLQLRNATIQEVMDRCLQGLPLTYRIVDKTVILMKPEETQQVKNITVSGVVLDNENREPLPGVSVSVKGSTGGTVSD